MKKYEVLEQYDFSVYAEEITGDALFLINGGAEIENSNKGVANAKPGDTLTRNDGTTVTITQGDIDWAKKQVGESETTATNSTPTSVTETSNSQPQQTSSSTSGTGKTNTTTKSGNYSTSAVSSTGTKSTESSAIQETAATADQTTSSARTSSEYQGVPPQYWDALDEQKAKKQDSVSLKYDPYDSSRVIVDLDDKTAMQQAADLLSEASLGFRVTAYGSESGITKEFKNYSEINDYINVKPNELISSENNVKGYLMAIENNPDDYTINAYQRRALGEGKKNILFTHSLYTIENNLTGEINTLSFNGTSLALFSKGAWGLNTETDVKSFKSLLNGNNTYDMELLYFDNKFNNKNTAQSIIKSIESSTTYFALDHLFNLYGMENCNTAFFNTVKIE